MRRSLILLLATGLVGMGLGCSRTLQHTAGVWDCDPPDVNSVLKPYAGITPATSAATPVVLAAPIAAPLVPQTMTPRAAEPPTK